MSVQTLTIGQKVHYNDGHGKIENGMVKSFHHDRLDVVFIVYHCAGEWSRYFDYTAALTPKDKLNYGWV